MSKTYTLFIFLLLLLFFIPALIQASVQKAVVFPDSARVWQQQSLQLQTKGQTQFTEFTLPAQARPETLRVNLEEGQNVRLSDVQWQKAKPEETEQVQELRQEIQELEQEKQEANAGLKAVAARISFWEEQTAFRDKNLEDLESLSRKISSSLEQGYMLQTELRQQIQDLEEGIQDLQEKLEEITGTEQASWQISLYLDHAAETDKIQVNYNYILNDCGWKPLYRLEAKPKQEELLFNWQARVWQSSGQDWQDTELSLATMRTPRRLDPPRIPDWIVRPAPEKPKPMARKDQALSMEAAAESAAPDLERRGTYSIWHLGQRSLAAGERPRLNIQEEAWPAEFVRLLRPSQGEQAFLQVKVQLEEARDIPRGQATFFWDGALLDKRSFRFQGREQTLHFGPDPFVTASLQTREKKSGVKGWLKGKQTYLWDFLLQLENSHDYPVQVRLEEPKPRLRDQRIEAEFEFSPEPAEKTESLFVWELELDQGQKQDIEMKIQMQAPEDMDIDWGWR
ncbi:MAG: DUF4139 domain-containing protein [Desulfohalobiaceae bacterium]